MNCTQCKDPGADCIAKDGTRLCQTCLYERVEKERDDALDEIVWLHERLRKVVAEERADAVAWMRRAADYVVTRRLMRECGCKPDDEAAKAARQCADAIEKGKHVGAAGEKK